LAAKLNEQVDLGTNFAQDHKHRSSVTEDHICAKKVLDGQLAG
jgi:hypothetical protein